MNKRKRTKNPPSSSAGTKSAAPALLPESEWKFAETQIPNEESEACLYYEYGREAEDFKRQVKAWRKRNPEVMRYARELLLVDQSMLEKAEPILARPPSPDAIPRDRKEAAVWKLSIILRCWFSQTLAIRGTEISELAHPDGTWDSARAFLYRFPPFPDTPWQDLDKSVRENALRFFWKPRQLKRSPDTTEAVKRQQENQSQAKIPLDEEALKTTVWEHGVVFVSVPALREGALLSGFLPLGYRLEKDGTQIWMGNNCHEQVHFVVNWAQSDVQIKKAFTQWLKTPTRRAHDPFESWKGAAPLDLLKKLGAFRLLNQIGMTAEKVCDYDLKTNKRKYDLYENPESYLRAKGEAETTLASMFPPADE